MKRSAVIFLSLMLTLVSLVAFIGTAWVWNRSRSLSDWFYRFEPIAGGSAMRGFASMKGAIVFGSIRDSSPSSAVSGYRHDVWAVMKGDGAGGGSMLQARPDRKVAALGFGVSDGELKLNIPFAFMLPKRTYHAVYIPYYFIMLLAAIQPVRVAWKLSRGRNLLSRGRANISPSPALSFSAGGAA